MHRSEWQDLARLRLREAKALLQLGHWSGAYYLSGYALECGLKSKLARGFRASTTPSKKLVNDIHTHDLATLVRLSGLEPERQRLASLDPDFAVNWGVAKDWSEVSRYQQWSEQEAKDMISAISDRSHGVMRWVRSEW